VCGAFSGKAVIFGKDLFVKSVYIIIVTYNGMRWIDKCLDSLKESKYPSTMLVIDNHSSDGTAAFIGRHYPDVRLTISSRNLGFGQANNIGMRKALEEGADYVFLLNQDAYVEPETIGRLVDAHAANASFGILSPLHFNGKGDALDVYFEQYLSRSSGGGGGEESSRGERRRDALVRTEFVNAAAWLISAGCLRQVGGFDPLFFHYGEDDNYAHRVLFHGWGIGVLTSARIRHDRELRTGVKGTDAVLKEEWKHILVRACDVRRPGYRVFMIRRGVRHGLWALKGLMRFDISSFKYHFWLSRRTLGYVGHVGRSRKKGRPL